MLNKILMDLYDDYSNGNEESLIEFADKTFKTEGVKRLFIGCTAILFTKTGYANKRYYCDRERLESIVLSGKEKVDDITLLQFYVEKLNDKKGINKYFKGLFEDKDFDKYVDLLIGYLNQFSFDFVNEVRKKVEKKM